jgi:hypothetical protein
MGREKWDTRSNIIVIMFKNINQIAASLSGWFGNQYLIIIKYRRVHYGAEQT